MKESDLSKNSKKGGIYFKYLSSRHAWIVFRKLHNFPVLVIHNKVSTFVRDFTEENKTISYWEIQLCSLIMFTPSHCLSLRLSAFSHYDAITAWRWFPTPSQAAAYSVTEEYNMDGAEYGIRQTIVSFSVSFYLPKLTLNTITIEMV